MPFQYLGRIVNYPVTRQQNFGGHRYLVVVEYCSVLEVWSAAEDRDAPTRSNRFFLRLPRKTGIHEEEVAKSAWSKQGFRIQIKQTERPERYPGGFMLVTQPQVTTSIGFLLADAARVGPFINYLQPKPSTEDGVKLQKFGRQALQLPVTLGNDVPLSASVVHATYRGPEYQGRQFPVAAFLEIARHDIDSDPVLHPLFLRSQPEVIYAWPDLAVRLVATRPEDSGNGLIFPEANTHLIRLSKRDGGTVPRLFAPASLALPHEKLSLVKQGELWSFD